MPNRKYPYYPSYDAGKETPGIRRLVNLCARRWKTKNLGTYVNRNMRNNANPPNLSVHATGAAADIKYKDETQARKMWDWFLGSSELGEHSKILGIVELHWYAFGSWGAGYRCSRGEGKAGVLRYTKTNNAGSRPGSPNWLHFELSPEMARDPDAFEAAWRSLPKPRKAKNR